MIRLFALLMLLLLNTPASAERVKDIARFSGVRANALTGYGIVVGLTGTGDQNLEFTIQSLKSATARLGVLLPPGVNPQLRNAAAVIVTAELAPFAKPGQRLDVTVAALGQAKSLRGGTLLLTALQGPDGEIYALAQGSLAVGGFGAEGRDGSRIVVGTPATGRVPGGGIIERAVASPFTGSGPLFLDLNEPDFSAAKSVADAINRNIGGEAARAEDGIRIAINAPDAPASRIALAARVEALDVTLQPPAAGRQGDRQRPHWHSGDIGRSAHPARRRRPREPHGAGDGEPAGQPARPVRARPDCGDPAIHRGSRRGPDPHEPVRAGGKAGRDHRRGERAGRRAGRSCRHPRSPEGRRRTAGGTGGDLMEIKPITMPIVRQPEEVKAAAKAGQDFEALLVTRLLKTARAAKLGDDMLGNNDQIRDMIDDQRGRAIAAAAPLGLAQLLAKEAGK